MLGNGVNSDDSGEFYPSVARNGALYFKSHRDSGLGGLDIYRSVPIDGKYGEAAILSSPPNSTNHEMDSFVSADESFIIMCSNRLEGFGGYDLFVSFRVSDLQWSQPVNLGEGVNTASAEMRPSITPDGNYLFFSSHRNGSGDIFWVDANVIEELRP